MHNLILQPQLQAVSDLVNKVIVSPLSDTLLKVRLRCLFHTSKRASQWPIGPGI